MFVLGLIVGIILAMVLFYTVVYPLALKYYNVTADEANETLGMMFEAGHDRESSIIRVKDDEAIDEVVFYE